MRIEMTQAELAKIYATDQAAHETRPEMSNQKIIKRAMVKGERFTLDASGKLWRIGPNKILAGYVSNPGAMLEAIDAFNSECATLFATFAAEFGA
jgi:hypothetical protein